MAEQVAESRQKGRAWCFTINNPTHKVLFPDGLPDGIKFIVYQLEKGEQGTPHLQGYLQLARPQAMSWLKKVTSKTAEGEIFHVFDRAHFIVAKGNADQNKAYCTKAEGRLEGPWTLGDAPKQGDRTDLKEAAEQLMKTGDIRAIDPGVFLKYASGCLKLAALAPPPRRDGLKVITIVGPTGIGKSYKVHDLYPDIYIVNMGNSGLWWDGYTGQKAVLFEEFKGQVQLQKMLQILDPYPLRLEIKGGLVPARFTVVFITSNYTPDKWYKNEDGFRDEEMKALARRLDVGDPTRIPAKPDGMKYIHVDTRDELHRRIMMLQTAGVIDGNRDNAAAAAAVAISDVACPMRMMDPPSRSETPVIVSDDEEPPRLKRANAHIVVDSDADMITTADGEIFVRDDIVESHAPKP